MRQTRRTDWDFSLARFKCQTGRICEPWYTRSKPSSDSETVSIGAIQKVRALGAVSVTRTRCQPSSRRTDGPVNSPLKRRFSLRAPDSKKRSSEDGARKLITDSMPMAMDWGAKIFSGWEESG